MKGLPLLLTAMSGSLGGLTFSHNAGGAYVRNRGIPTQPNTPEQVAVKASFSELSTAWRQDLTAQERDDWDLYAAATPLTDKIGQPFFPTGLNMYVRGNTSLLTGGHPRVDGGPVLPGLPSFTAPSVASITASTNILSLTFDDSDAWAAVDETHLLIFASRGQGQSINFFKGPYRFSGSIDGNSLIAPTSPGTLALPFNVAVGQKVFFRATLIDEQGRKGTDTFFEGTAV